MINKGKTEYTQLEELEKSFNKITSKIVMKIEPDSRACHCRKWYKETKPLQWQCTYCGQTPDNFKIIIIFAGKKFLLSHDKRFNMFSTAQDAYDFGFMLINKLKHKEKPKQIYFIHAPKLNKIKIGITINIKKRLDNLKGMVPCELHLMLTINGEEQLESDLHERFSKYRTTGEWFETSEEILRFITDNQNEHGTNHG